MYLSARGEYLRQHNAPACEQMQSKPSPRAFSRQRRPLQPPLIAVLGCCTRVHVLQRKVCSGRSQAHAWRLPTCLGSSTIALHRHFRLGQLLGDANILRCLDTETDPSLCSQSLTLSSHYQEPLVMPSKMSKRGLCDDRCSPVLCCGRLWRLCLSSESSKMLACGSRSVPSSSSRPSSTWSDLVQMPVGSSAVKQCIADPNLVGNAPGLCPGSSPTVLSRNSTRAEAAVSNHADKMENRCCCMHYAPGFVRASWFRHPERLMFAQTRASAGMQRWLPAHANVAAHWLRMQQRSILC